MNTLNFASYAKAIKSGISKSTNIGVTKLLLEFIIEDENVVNKEKEQYHIKNDNVGRWINQHENIPSSIKDAAASYKIMSKAEDYFEEKVVTELSPQKELDTYSTLLELIKSDNTMSDLTKGNLLGLYDNNELGKFLSDTFLYAIQKENKIKTETKNNNKQFKISSLEENINRFYDICSKLPQPIKLIPEEALENHEIIYTSELFVAYSDAKGDCQITKENLKKYPKYQKNFERQRKNYYAAESIRQSARDTFCSVEIDPFDMLKEETYTGIIDTHECDYCHGFERLNRVMEHVTTLDLSKSLLTKIPGWIGISEKKGICHMLVNDRQIKWVDEDE